MPTPDTVCPKTIPLALPTTIEVAAGAKNAVVVIGAGEVVCAHITIQNGCESAVSSIWFAACGIVTVTCCAIPASQSA
jgi:hypothetical protein